MTRLRVTRAGSLPLSADGRAFLLCCLECPCIPDGRAGKGNARPAARRGRDNRVEVVNLGGNHAPARGRNRNSRPEPTPTAALAGFLGPAGMAGGSTGFGTCQGWGERASARRSPALSIAQSETGVLAESPYLYQDQKHWPYLSVVLSWLDFVLVVAGNGTPSLRSIPG